MPRPINANSEYANSPDPFTLKSIPKKREIADSQKLAINKALGLVIKPEDRYVCNHCKYGYNHDSCDTLRQGRIMVIKGIGGKDTGFSDKVCVCSCYGFKPRKKGEK